LDLVLDDLQSRFARDGANVSWLRASVSSGTLEVETPEGEPDCSTGLNLDLNKTDAPVAAMVAVLALHQNMRPGRRRHIGPRSSHKTEIGEMSQYIRREFQHFGKKNLVILIHGDLGFPYLLIDRQREHVGVTISFEWWADDERFYFGFPPCIFILDSRNQTLTVRSAGWCEEGIPVMITAPIEIEISVEELKLIYRATCRRSGLKPIYLDDIRSRREFVTRILAGRGMADIGSA
jgi:hypothetical protein